MHPKTSPEWTVYIYRKIASVPIVDTCVFRNNTTLKISQKHYVIIRTTNMRPDSSAIATVTPSPAFLAQPSVVDNELRPSTAIDDLFHFDQIRKNFDVRQKSKTDIQYHITCRNVDKDYKNFNHL